MSSEGLKRLRGNSVSLRCRLKTLGAPRCRDPVGAFLRLHDLSHPAVVFAASKRGGALSTEDRLPTRRTPQPSEPIRAFSQGQSLLSAVQPSFVECALGMAIDRKEVGKPGDFKIADLEKELVERMMLDGLTREEAERLVRAVADPRTPKQPQ